MKTNKFDAPLTVPSLTFDQKESMLMHILRLPKLFIDAKRCLEVSHFNTDEIRYALIWKAALAISDGGALPLKGANRRIEEYIKVILDSDPGYISQEQQEDLFSENGFLIWCFNEPEDCLYEKDGRALLEQFLRERLIINPLKRYIQNAGEDVPLDLPAVLRQFEEHERTITATKTNPIMNSFPENWKMNKVKLTPIGVPFLEEFMKGHAGGEAYGLLGPIGVGKTTLGLQIAVEGAEYEQRVAKSDEEMGHWYFFSYESSVDTEIRPRVMCYAAKIHRETIFEGGEFSTANNLKEYEKKKWAAAISTRQYVPGEQERFEAASKLNKNLWLVDMSGSIEDNPSIGSGGVEEIASYLALEQGNGKRIAGVVIDYVGIAAKRQMAKVNADMGELRHYIGGYGDQARMLLAARFNCPVWLLHQLASEANLKTPTTKQHFANASEAKNFAENLWFCFSLGTKTDDSHCLIFCSKARRAALTDRTPVIKIDGAFCAMLPDDKNYTVMNNQIVPTSFKSRSEDSDDIDSKLNKLKISHRPNPAAAVGFSSR